MRVSSTAVYAAIAAGLLVGCAGSLSSTPGSLPNGGGASPASNVRHADWTPVDLAGNLNTLRKRRMLGLDDHRIPPPGTKGGYYASEFAGSLVPAWSPKPNTENNPPLCSVSGQTYYVNGIASDQKGDLIVPGSD
jgi:hypothetical protein